VAILYGNLAPGGAMVKTFSVPEEMHVHTGSARVFDFEEEAVHALVKRQVSPGDVLSRSMRPNDVWRSSELKASTARRMKSRRYSRSGAGSGSHRGRATIAGFSPCMNVSPAALLKEPLLPKKECGRSFCEGDSK
jgi:Dehydratase family